MKKLFLIISVLGLVTLASCNKEKDCECTTKTTGMGDAVTTITIEDGECSDGNSSTSMMGIDVTVTCKEK